MSVVNQSKQIISELFSLPHFIRLSCAAVRKGNSKSFKFPPHHPTTQPASPHHERKKSQILFHFHSLSLVFFFLFFPSPHFHILVAYEMGKNQAATATMLADIFKAREV